jgi:hypothetical protein
MVPGRVGPQRAGERSTAMKAVAAVLVVSAVLLGACGGGSSGVRSQKPPTTTTTASSSPPLTIGIICTTPTDAAQAFVAAWMAGDRGAAGRCATPVAVSTLFAHNGRGAGWTFQACGGPDPGVPVCTFAYSGGTARLTLNGTEAAGWMVAQVQLG